MRHLEDARAHVVKRVHWPQPLVPSFPAWKQDALARALLDAASPLRQALEDLKREERETEVTMTVKWDAMAKQREALMAVILAGAAQDQEPEAPVNEPPPEGQESPPTGIVTP